MKIPVEKNKEYIVEIIDNGFEGEGIAKVDNFAIFVPNAIISELLFKISVIANTNNDKPFSEITGIFSLFYLSLI